MKYVIVGCGKVGSRLAQELVAEGHEVSIVAESSGSFRRLPPEFDVPLIVGTATDEDVLERAGARGADGLAAVTDDDNFNIMTAELARLKFGVRNAIARVYDVELADFYQEQGIRTICPTMMVVGSVSDALHGDELMFAIIVGGGKVGESLAAALLAEGQEVVLLERDRSQYTVLLEKFPEAAFYGDGTEIRTLREAGCERADAVVPVTGEDQVNLVVSEVAVKMFKVRNVVARVNDPKNFELFRRAGVERPVSSTHLLMATIHQEVEPGDVFRLASLRQSNLEIVEVFIPDRSPSVGLLVRDVSLPAGAMLLAVQRTGRWMRAELSTEIQPADVYIALAPTGGESQIREVLSGR